jgi:hypothetical protein
MAKKKRRIIEEAEEEYEFTPTEFNEREFILKDIYGSKIFVVTIAFAFAVGVIGAVLINHWDSDYAWIVATLISFGVMGAMKPILGLLGFRPEMIETKTLLGAYLMYLAFALGICIIGINAPFA